MTLWRLEWLRLVRTKRVVPLFFVHLVFGFLGPFAARYLPDILERFAGDEIEVVVSPAEPADGMLQFVQNVSQAGLLVVVVVSAAALCLDVNPGMAAFLRTRSGDGRRLVLPRFVVNAGAAAAAFAAGGVLAWYETSVLLGALPPVETAAGIVLGATYLIFAVAVVAAVGSVTRSMLATVGLSLATLLAVPVVALVDPVERWLPSHLVGALPDLVAGGAPSDYLPSLAVTVVAIVGLVAVAARRAVRPH